MGSRSEVGDTTLWNVKIRRGWRPESLYVATNLASGGGTAFTVDEDMPPVIVIGASAARNVRLPAVSAANANLTYTIISRSTTTTGVLTLLSATGAALSPAVTIAQNAQKTVTLIAGLGWRVLSA
jgi:hypothetical protein